MAGLQDDLLLLDDLAEERLLSLADALAQGEPWALWAGAGLSCAGGLPSWSGLVRAVAKRFGVPIPGDDAEIASTNYPSILSRCLASGPHEFWQFIEAKLCGGTPAAVHDLMVSLPFELYVTTNYDCLLEAAHERHSVPSPRVVGYPELNSRYINSRRLVYLHGRCPCSDEATTLSEDRVVLTEHSYQQAYEPSGSNLSNLLQSILTDFSILFAGASLNDWQQMRLMEVARELRDAATARSGRPPQRHLALTMAPTSATGVAADDTFPGTRFGIYPIFYRPDPTGGHGAVELIARWLASAVKPATSAFKVGP